MYPYYLFLLLLISMNAQAKQTSFNKVKAGNSYEFSYRWLNAERKNESLSFNLNKQAILNKFRGFTRYQAETVSQQVTKDIYRELKKKPIKGARVKFNKNGEKYSIEIIGQNQSAVAKAQKTINELRIKKTNDYLETHFYHKFISFNNEVLVKPNHVDIANKSVEDLRPLKNIILNKLALKNIKSATNYTLSFVQNIPYSRLESRATSSGAGFNPPLKLLWENQGDCDSKVTLTAAILRMLMPRIKMVMVFLGDHALIGIHTKVNKGDNFITLNHVRYVLAEPTGPMQYPLGEISPESEMAIANGHYTVEKFHAVKKLKHATNEALPDDAAEESENKEEQNHFSDELAQPIIDIQ